MRRGRVRSAQLLVFASTVIAACDRRDAPSTRDSPSDSAVTSPVPSGGDANWVTELGPLLVVPSDTDNAGIVLFPADPSTGLVSAMPLTLVNASGDSTSTRAALVVSDSQVCGEAPIVRLPGPVPQAWSVGFRGSSVRALSMDSIESLPPADSASFTADLARLASALPMPAQSRFLGLPFVVLTARRFDLDGRQILAAHLRRRLPQEATPLEEHTLLIAERATPGEPFVGTHSVRSEGTEETADQFEVLAAMRARGRTLLLVARDRAARTMYEILERTSTGQWRARWSRTLSC
jgi:hypothetical protein